MIDSQINLIFLLIGFNITYYLYSRVFCIHGPNKNTCSLKFNQTSKFHIHHWIIHTVLLLTVTNLIKNSILRSIFIGANIAGILHGILTYDNWYVIFK
jgi:hypothetical protein